MRRITLDFFNNSADVSLDGVIHVFASAQQFSEKTGFNFPDVMLVSVEVERNLFAVEYTGGRVVLGEDQPPIEWLIEHTDQIKNIASAELEIHNQRNTPSWSETRHITIATTDWLVLRHRDQQEMLVNTSLTSDQYQQLLQYRQQLRDAIPDSELPSPPGFLAVEGS